MDHMKYQSPQVHLLHVKYNKVKLITDIRLSLVFCISLITNKKNLKKS